MKFEDLTFEQAFEKLESIVTALEQGDMTLDESIQSFEEGMKLIGQCSAKLEDAENRLQTLLKKDDGSFELASTD